MTQERQALSPILLDILVCPANKSPLRLAKPDELVEINQRVAAGKLKSQAGEKIDTPFEALLVREDGAVGYRVKNGIPIMLINESAVLKGSN